MKKKNLSILNHASPIKNRVKPVLNPSAQSRGLCCQGYGSFFADTSSALDFFLNSTYPVQVKAIIEVLYLSGCRVTQALSIKPNNISLNGKIQIKAAKGGKDTLCNPIHFKEFWINYRDGNSCFDNFINRFFIYRVCKNIGAVYKSKNNIKASVTHSFRHSLANELNLIEKDSNLISDVLGHKSLKTKKYYIHE